MPPYLTRHAAIGIAVETAWGTAVTTATMFTEVRGIRGFKREITFTERGTLGRPADTATGIREVDISEDIVRGTFDFIPQYANLTMLLCTQCLGTNTDSGTASPYTHTMKSADELDAGRLGLTIQPTLGGQPAGTLDGEKFEGCMVESLELGWTAGEAYPTGSCTVLGETSNGRETPTTATFSAFAPILANQLDSDQVTFNSVNYTGIRSLRLWIANNYQTRAAVGIDTTLEPVKTGQVVELTVELEKAGTQLYAAHLAKTQTNVTFGFTGSGANAFPVVVYNAHVASYDEDVTGAGPIVITVVFRAKLSGSNPLCQIAATNANATVVVN